MTHPIYTYRKANGLTMEKFGALVGVEKAAVSRWEDGARPSPINAIEIEKATGGQVQTWQLRPDLWPAPTHQRQKRA